MKKFLLLLILSLQVSLSFAQNYQCVQPGVKHYFINAGHYLRGIRIDSVKMVGNASVLYPFRSFRGDSTLDTNGGCWMGKTIVVNNDGTTWFNCFWNDTVVIKTQAALYDSWTFYNDTSSRYYTARVTSLDTMTVLGVLDSIKTITLTCKKGNVTLTTDAFHNAQIIISKNHGFVQTYDLDMFPLQKMGVDYLTDNAGWAAFTLVDFQNPTMFDFYDYNIGDIFKRWHIVPAPQPVITLATVISKQILSPTQIQYTLFQYSQTTPPGSSTLQTTVDTVHELVRFEYFADTAKMPEEWGTIEFYYYDPTDSFGCVNKSYGRTPNDILYPIPMIDPGPPTSWRATYKKGLGEIKWYSWNGNFPIYEDLLSAYKGYICDSMPTLAVKNTLAEEQSLSLYPNPSTGLFTIDNASNAIIQQISFYNVLGSKVYEVNITEQKNKYTIALPENVKGMLYCTIRTDSGTVIKKVVVE